MADMKKRKLEKQRNSYTNSLLCDAHVTLVLNICWTCDLHLFGIYSSHSVDNVGEAFLKEKSVVDQNNAGTCKCSIERFQREREIFTFPKDVSSLSFGGSASIEWGLVEMAWEKFQLDLQHWSQRNAKEHSVVAGVWEEVPAQHVQKLLVLANHRMVAQELAGANRTVALRERRVLAAESEEAAQNQALARESAEVARDLLDHIHKYVLNSTVEALEKDSRVKWLREVKGQAKMEKEERSRPNQDPLH